jgi:hypothetical protein
MTDDIPEDDDVGRLIRHNDVAPEIVEPSQELIAEDFDEDAIR